MARAPEPQQQLQLGRRGSVKCGADREMQARLAVRSAHVDLFDSLVWLQNIRRRIDSDGIPSSFTACDERVTRCCTVCERAEHFQCRTIRSIVE
jgi:hypothetical protein